MNTSFLNAKQAILFGVSVMGLLGGCEVSPQAAQKIYCHLWVAANGFEVPPPDYRESANYSATIQQVQR